MNAKKILATVAMCIAIMVGSLTMTACTPAQVGGGLIGIISSSWGWNISNSSSQAFTINFGDTLTRLGISQGSSARINFLSNNRVRVDFTIKLGATASTHKVEEGLTEIFQQLLGRNDVSISSSSNSAANTTLKFSIMFG